MIRGFAAGLCALAALGPGCARRPAAPPPSLLLVTIDTLRADRVGAYGSRAGATPNLDALAARGTVFAEARAAVPLTLPSHATILSGLEPLHHGVRDNGVVPFPERGDTLATRLKAAGYATGAFVGAYVLDRRFGLARGFDVYDDRIARRTTGASVLESERPCQEVVAATTRWLESRSGPFFAWVHFYDPHAPYDPPPTLRERFAGRPYEGDVAHADACLAPVLEAAARRAGERLVVAVLADHGEGLDDHGERTHGLFVYESTLRVPFVVAGFGVPRGERRRGLARTADVAPTLLGRLGRPLPAGLDGQDLFAGPPPREAYAESLYPESFGWAPLRALRLGALKYIEAPRPELYDLAADPGEAHDLAAVRQQDAARLRAALAAARSGEVRAEARSADPVVAERLRALGYVAASRGTSTGDAPRTDPKDALAMWREFERAVADEARGERETALVTLHGLVGRDPGNTAFRRSLAAALRRAGRPGEAARALGDLERAAPDDAAAWHELAATLAEAGQTDAAVKAARRATALDPSLPDAWIQLGRLLAAAGGAQEALTCFERATALDPNGAKAWNNRANALRELGRPGEAEAAYRTAAELDPADPDPWNGLGVIAVERGKLDEAARAFENILSRDDRHHEARLNLAVVEAQRGHLETARRLATRVAKESPDAGLQAKARAFLRDLG